MQYDYNALPHPGIQTLSPYVPGKSVTEVAAEHGISDIIKLASNENVFGCSPNAIEALQHLNPMTIASYPSARHHPLHQELSDFLNIDPDMLSIANGSDSLFGLLLNCFALHQNKHMLTHDYAFSSYAIQAHGLGVAVVSTPTQDWKVDIDALIQACSDETALIFIANPNNPTGLVVDVDEIQRILDHIPASTLLVLDEAYYEFLSPLPDTISLLQRYRNLVITRTFSKAYGLAGLRLGYAIADPQIIATIQKIHLPFTANIAALTAARAALTDQSFIHDTIKKITTYRNAMSETLTQQAIHHLPSSANFLTIDCGCDALPIAQALESQGIIVRPLHPYGMSSYLRVTIGTEAQNQRFLETFFSILKTNTKQQG
ncbi:MAG: histidinol-phosphate transaminase [Gammaproteobacteria bacterium]|nr:histidinol-phosphate transaminase [Gammaproteobacteria bacterium]